MNRRSVVFNTIGTCRLLSFIIFAAILAVALLVSTGCGSGDKKDSGEPETFEIALVTDASSEGEGTFSATTWSSVQSFGEEYELTCAHYKANIAEGSSDEDTIDESSKAIDEAMKKGARVMIFAGSFFETAVHDAQQKHDDIYFILLDGVPRDDEHNYELSANSTGVLFAEEEAGFLAGYAAVADGHRKLGFVGGEELPPVKRYGYGFMQGIAAAAKEGKISDIELKYCYTDTFDSEDWIVEGAYEWYSSGTQVIFACGGAVGNSVIQAAEKGGKDQGASESEESEVSPYKVIGVDTDQSNLSPVVITSARKEIRTAIFDILKTYIHDNFKGNSIFNYDLKNNGVSLEMTNARFDSFSNSAYAKLVKEIQSGKITIEKEMGDKSLKDLAPEGIKVTENKIKK